MNDIEVIINSKRYILRGYESEEYLQKVASYINNKHSELKNQGSYKMLDSDTKNVLLEINLADDYFKIKNRVKDIEVENESKSNEIFDLKHELISVHSKLTATQKELDECKQELHEAQKTIIRLETELMDRNR